VYHKAGGDRQCFFIDKIFFYRQYLLYKEYAMGYSIGQVAKMTGISAYTLRYYEKEGLLPFVKKSASGVRIFSDNDIGWLEMINCLKGCGMPLKGIRQYIDWFAAGDATVPQRLAMFQKQKENLTAQLEQLHRYMAHIDFKIALYARAAELGSFDKARALPEMQAAMARVQRCKNGGSSAQKK